MLQLAPDPAQQPLTRAPLSRLRPKKKKGGHAARSDQPGNEPAIEPLSCHTAGLPHTTHTTMRSTFVIYHANCPDGFAAAWVAALHFAEFGPAEVTYIPATYGDPLPDMPADSDVFILDFSYPRDVLTQLAERCRICVLDHHATAQAALADLPFATFDMKKSGAVLAWEHFYPTRDVPELLLYIQDRDLWQWRMPNSRAVNAALWRGTPRDFSTWNDLHYLWHKGVTTAEERLVQAGEAIAFSDGLMVQNLCRAPTWLRILCYNVPAVNSPVLQSEIGHELLLQYPNAPFAAAWWILDDGKPTFSLRSRPNGVDVSVIAKEFGGGGHKAAAGFRPSQMFELIEKKKGAQQHEDS
jgi:uncharacterized protein